MSKPSEWRFPQFVKRFRELRGEHNNVDFARSLEIPTQTVVCYLNGDRMPNAMTLRKIAEKCNVSADWLLGLTEVPRYDNARVDSNMSNSH